MNTTDWSAFGKLSNRGTERKRQDLSNGEAVLLVMPSTMKGAAKNIIISPAACEMLGLDQENTQDQHITMSFGFAASGRVIVNLPDNVIADAGDNLKPAALKKIYTDNENAGLRFKGANFWKALGGTPEQTGVLSLSLEATEFNGLKAAIFGEPKALTTEETQEDTEVQETEEVQEEPAVNIPESEAVENTDAVTGFEDVQETDVTGQVTQY